MFWCVTFNRPHSEHWIEDDGVSAEFVLHTTNGVVSTKISRIAGVHDDVVAKYGSNARVESVKLGAGERWPRIFRPPYGLIMTPPEPREWTAVHQATRILLAQLDELFLSVEPRKGNDTSYGHRSRQLLLLACTEFESFCKAVMRANGYADPQGTKDYVKLVPALLLEEYEVELTLYPDYPPLRPFQGWNAAGGSTKTLPWYNAYNDVKHEREISFPSATLANAIAAVAACYVMVHAQFGTFEAPSLVPPQSLFRLTQSPSFPVAENYVPPFFASPSGTTTFVKYPF